MAKRTALLAQLHLTLDFWFTPGSAGFFFRLIAPTRTSTIRGFCWSACPVTVAVGPSYAGDSGNEHLYGGTPVAQQTSVSLVDDLDGSKAAETVAFGLDGSTFEIDLSKKNAAALRKALTEFVEHGRRIKPNAAAKPGSRRSTGRSGASPAAIREWAAGQGISISPRGRVASDIVAQYEAANA